MSGGFSQQDANGRLRHLITLDGVPRPLMAELLDRAQAYVTPAGALAHRRP